MRKDDWDADFSVFDGRGQLAVVAEAKKAVADSLWAAEWFQNFSGRQRSAPPPYVMLATPEKIYVWKRTTETEFSEPAVVDAYRMLTSYLRGSKLDVRSIDGSTFEFIVGAWLHHFVLGLWQPSEPDEKQAFVDSGLLDLVENGRFASNVAA
jgi:hypothetical protein